MQLPQNVKSITSIYEHLCKNLLYSFFLQLALLPHSKEKEDWQGLKARHRGISL